METRVNNQTLTKFKTENWASSFNIFRKGQY